MDFGSVAGEFMRRLGFLLTLVLPGLVGCLGDPQKPDLVWGKKGVRDGDFSRPRACTLLGDRLYVVDFTARVQAFDLDGKHLGLTWTTPDYRKGRPSGLGIDNDGNLLVADSHYSCVRVYTPDGKLLRTLAGPFGYVSDVVQDADGNYYLTEFGEVQRISKLGPDGKLLARWGSQGPAPGQFSRPRAITLGPDDNLYVADACNHRIQVFDRAGRFLRAIGSFGDAPGELQYPYDVAFDSAGNLFVAEFGNHRVQKFTPEGTSLGTWGGPGREPGRLHCPWGLVVDRKGRVHVLDTENHRVQRVVFENHANP